MISFSLLVVAITAAALAMFVWRARPYSTVNCWFAAFTISGAGWVLGVAALHAGRHLDAWSRLTFASASLIPAMFLCFAHSYPTASRWPSRVFIRVALCAAIAFSLLSLTTPLIVYDTSLTTAGLTRKSGLLYPLFAFYFLIAWSSALGVCLHKWRQARGQERVQLQHLGAAMLLTGAGAISVNLVLPLVTGRSMHSWIGPYFGLVFIALVAHAIIDRKSTRLNSSHLVISYAVFCLKKKKNELTHHKEYNDT